MKFEKAIDGFGTTHALKRFAGAYVVDHTKLTVDEIKAALGKAAPQYFHEKNLRSAIERCFLHSNREVRTIAPIFLGQVLLNCDQFMSSESETHTKIVAWEKSIIDNSNEDLFSKKSSRSASLELFQFVLSVAWEQNDSISVDEKHLIDKLKARLLITEREYRVMEAALGKFPRAGNIVHSREEVDEVRRILQSEGLVASVRDSDNVDYDVVPDEVAENLRQFFNNEVRRYGYEQLIETKWVKKKDWLTSTLEKVGFEVEGNPNAESLKELVMERVAPSVLLGGVSQKDGLKIGDLKGWCADLGLMTSGLKPDLISRILGFYDNLTSRSTSDEDPRELWYKYFEKFASRDRDFLRSQQLIDKDNEMEARFEDATDYLFEVKLGHKPLKMVAVEHADGMLSHGDRLILWDNKSKESDVHLSSHIKQFDRYVKQQTERPVSGFIVIGPSFSSESEAEAMRYQVEHGTAISLITAAELKDVAEIWSQKDKGTFPLGYLILPGRFKRSILDTLR
ncbi:MAG: hypothetical protein ACJAVK_002309 [Akkermansiaceae bacterium]|jgi:hypothetical protein